jgi:hypothetical protein
MLHIAHNDSVKKLRSLTEERSNRFARNQLGDELDRAWGQDSGFREFAHRLGDLAREVFGVDGVAAQGWAGVPEEGFIVARKDGGVLGQAHLAPQEMHGHGQGVNGPRHEPRGGWIRRTNRFVEKHAEVRLVTVSQDEKAGIGLLGDGFTHSAFAIVIAAGRAFREHERETAMAFPQE